MGHLIALVTGAGGFIGRHVAGSLRLKGMVVHGIGHGTPSPAQLADWGISRWVTGDISKDVLKAWGEQPHVVYHCAGAGTVSAVGRDPLDDFSRSVVGTAELLDYLRQRAPTAPVVLASSAAVYGHASDQPLKESTPAKPISPYGFHKLAQELLCAEWALHYGLRCSLVRLFSVYGPELRKQLLWDACNKLSSNAGLFGGTGEERRDWVHVTDTVDLLHLAAKIASPDCIAINGGTGSAPCVAEVLVYLSRVLGTAPPRFSGERRPGDPVVLRADAAMAVELGWRARISWQDGIREYAEWFMKNGGI